jgi:hypothetical protein
MHILLSHPSCCSIAFVRATVSGSASSVMPTSAWRHTATTAAECTAKPRPLLLLLPSQPKCKVELCLVQLNHCSLTASVLQHCAGPRGDRGDKVPFFTATAREYLTVARSLVENRHSSGK